jgi:hypothetical protein
MAYNLQSWQNTFGNNPVNRGILGSAFNTNPLTARGMNILGSNVALGIPLAYASMANKLQKNLPKSLTGDGGIADQNPYFGGMGVAVEPEVEETLRYGDAVTDVNYPGGNPYYGQRSPHKGFEEMQFDETVQAPEKKGFNFPSIFGTVKGGLEWLGDKFKRPEAKQRAYEEIMKGGTYKGKGGYELYDTPSGLKIGSDILGTGQGYAKNFDSMFGSRSIEEMEQKKLDWARERIRKGKAISKRLQTQVDLADGAPKDITSPTITTTGGSTSPNVHGGGSEASFTQRSPGGISQATSRAARTDQRGNVMSGWNLAEGGRIGLYAGGDPEEPAEDIREIMQDQNIPFSEQVEGEEGILQQLYAKYIEAGFPPDQAEAMAMQEFEQMAAGPEQDQGLASLV